MNLWNKKGDISASALLILNICFLKLSTMTPTVLQEGNAIDIGELPFKTWCLDYPQCSLATERHPWRQLIRLDAASSGATNQISLRFLKPDTDVFSVFYWKGPTELTIQTMM